MQITIDDSDGVNEVYKPFMDDNTYEQVFFGGSSSGKSHFILSQRLIARILAGGRNFLVIRKVQRTNKDSTFNQVLAGINFLPDMLKDKFEINKSEMKIVFTPNQSTIFFRGLDDPEKLKGVKPVAGVITDVVFEEVSEITFDDVKLVKRRVRGKSEYGKVFTYLTNPVSKQHWLNKEYCLPVGFQIKDKVYKSDRLLIVHTTYKDNIDNLGDDEVFELENEKSQYYYDVYTLGKWGVLGDVVFTNWETADLSQMENGLNYYYHGLDFGWNAPTAYVKIYLKGDNIYIVNSYYKRQAKFKDLVANVKPMSQKGYIICDSAEPRSIETLKDYGLDNVYGCKKTPDHMKHAIRWLQGKNIIIDKELIEVQNEFSLYQYKKVNGETLDEPVKKNDHAIQAMVYALEDVIYDKTSKIEFMS